MGSCRGNIYVRGVPARGAFKSGPNYGPGIRPGASPVWIDQSKATRGVLRIGVVVLSRFIVDLAGPRCADTCASMGNGQVGVGRHLCGDGRSAPVVLVLLVSIGRLVYVSPQDRKD